jgi:GT2 family glycosyltransferase
MGQRVEGGFEVLLIDNGSSDRTAEYVRSRYPSVRVLEPGRNLGFCGGFNLGERHASGRYLVSLDNDTRVRPDWLHSLVAAVEVEPSAGAITSKLLIMGRPAVLNAAGLLLFDDGFGACRGWLEEDCGQYEQREEVFGGPGCGLLLRRQVLEEVGGLDPSFFAYYEDADLCWRMRLHGWRVIYEPKAVVEHRHSGSTASPTFIFLVNRNRIFMMLKNASPELAWSALTGGAWLDAAPEFWQLPIKAKVAISVAAHLPEMLLKRFHNRRGRRVTDAEIDLWRSSRARWDERFVQTGASSVKPN